MLVPEESKLTCPLLWVFCELRNFFGGGSVAYRNFDLEGSHDWLSGDLPGYIEQRGSSQTRRIEL